MIRKIYNLVLMFIVIILCSCERPSSDKSGRQVYSIQKDGNEGFKHYHYEVIIIDSCEYITDGWYKLAHKGNCAFCAQRHKKGD